MSETVQVEVIAVMDADKRSEQPMVVRRLSSSERLLHAAKAVGAAWLAAVLCILVPVLHFFLVPAAFLIGCFLGYRRIGLGLAWVQGNLTCPACAHPLPHERAPYAWPLTVICSHCQARLRIRPVSG